MSKGMLQNQTLTGKERLGLSFAWLNGAQFLGAFNDNVLKFLIIFFIIKLQGQSYAGVVAAKAGAIFVLPFLIFSPLAGVLADRLSKQRVIAAMKIFELTAAGLGSFFFLARNENGLYAVLFMMAIHSALFAPSKYGIIPELVTKEQLSYANGLIESFGYLAIILGTAFASMLVEVTDGDYARASLGCVVVAAAGLAAALRIRKTPPANLVSSLRVPYAADTLRSLGYIAQDRELLLAVLGSAFFMLLGAYMQMNLIPYGIQVLGLTQEKSGYLFLMAALGIGSGSFAAGRLSGRSVEFGIVPLGAVMLTLASFTLYLTQGILSTVLSTLFILGFSAGLFIVPLQAFIQLRSPKDRLGEILAVSVFLNWAGVLLAAGMTYLLTEVMHMPARQAFAALGILTLVLSVIAVRTLPDFLVRFLMVLATRLFYRIRVIGSENIPVKGPALLIANHVTWVDALLLGATQQRRIRFIMERKIYNQKILNPLFRLMKVIPVSADDSRKQLVEFVHQSRTALEGGYIVCIFAEGAITRNGMIGEFKSGLERIVSGTGYPIIPTYIGGAWGSIFSYAHGRLLSRLPIHLPYPISILFGNPLPPDKSPFEIQQAVTQLSCDYFESLKGRQTSLAETFVRTARKNWGRLAVSDTLGKTLTYGSTLAGALAISNKIKALVGDDEKVGILLPSSVAGVLVNLGTELLGKIPVNLNFTASPEAFRSAIDQCNIRRIITSRSFIEKTGILLPENSAEYIEDIISGISSAEKRKAWLKAKLLPSSALLKKRDFSPDDIATIIFSSGSSGDPKGVMLSHHNILSNIEGIQMVFRISKEDNICAALPFFHSLGFTGTIWLPLLSGFSATYHTNPTEGTKIAEIVREHRSTLLLTTPTFLFSFMRRARREDFASLRLIVTGAEKLKVRVADAFEEKFGIRPLEGYGATELSPVVALNVPDVDIDGVRQTGSREGSVGHPLPGVAIRIVDPNDGRELAMGVQGLIQVKGPNVMRGYLDNTEQTAHAIRDGWYQTEDIGMLDERGFLTITDRLSRFSKIAGEMIPHAVIEDELHARLNLPGQVVAVTSIPDDKKGEKLVVIYAKGVGDTEKFHRALADSSLPNLWKPDRNHYLEVPSLPVLGTGKLDIKGLRQIAVQAFANA